MKLITAKQNQWLSKRTIKENGVYMFPRFGFMVYSEPNYSSGRYMDTNPFTRSLDKETFLVREKINGFCKGNFYHKPKGNNFYLSEDELSRRDRIEVFFLSIVTFIPMVIYNLLIGKR